MSLLAAILFVMTYTEPRGDSGEPRASLLLNAVGGSFDIARFDDAHLLPESEEVPAAMNGFLELQDAVALLPENAKDEARLLVRLRTGKEEWDGDTVSRILAERKDLLATLDRLLAKPRIQFPRTPRLDDPTGDELFKALTFASYFNVRVRDHSTRKEWANAMNALKASAAFSKRMVECQGALVHYLVGISIEIAFLQEVERLLMNPHFPPDQIGVLVRILEERPDHLDSLQVAWKNEYLMLRNLCLDLGNRLPLTQVQRMGNEGEQPGGLEGVFRRCLEQLALSFSYQPNRTRQSAASCFDYILALGVRDRVDRGKIPKPEILRQLEARERRLFLSANPVGHMILAMALPRHESLMDRVDTARCYREALRVTAALRVLESQSGELPASLDGLVPDYLAAPVKDPFTGKPLRYSKDKRKLWTPGADGVDEGGAPQGEEPGSFFGDKRGWRDPAIRLGWLGG